MVDFITFPMQKLQCNHNDLHKPFTRIDNINRVGRIADDRIRQDMATRPAVSATINVIVRRRGTFVRGGIQQLWR